MIRVTSEHLTVGLLFVAIAVLAALAPVQSDTWWHLRAGLDVWTTGQAPFTDTYSYTAHGRDWPNHQWLTAAVFYGAWQLGGLPLLQLVAAALIVLAMTVSWRLTTGEFELRFLLFAASLTGAVGSWAVRAQVFSLLGFAITCWLLVRGRWWWLPPLIALWTNLHAAAILGVVAAFAAAGAAAVRDRRVEWRPVAVVLLCVLATGISPQGFGIWFEIPESIRRSQINQLVEWRPAGIAPSLWAFWAMVVMLPVLVAARWRRLDTPALKLAAIALAVAPLAIRAVRNVPIFLLVAVPALTAVWASGRPAPRRRTPRERFGLNAGLLAAGALAGVLVVALAWWRPPRALGWRPIGPAAASAIRACPDPIYNTFEQGGILIWFVPEKPVFLDNRQDPYPADLLRDARAVELSGEYEALFDRYGFRCAVMPPGSPTAGRLATDTRWQTAYADDRWVVFIRSAAPPASR